MEQMILGRLKIDLGITTTAYDYRLLQYIESAKLMIQREGATLSLESESYSEEDVMLVVMYAAWMWRRRDTGEGMPRMLRYALNNKIFSEKMR